jgi:hypothetical protein
MKHTLALLLLSCVLVAQDKPAAEAPKPAAVEKPEESKPKIPPINVRDELIELIHQLKEDARQKIEDPLRFASPNYMQAAAAEYEASMKAKTEAQRLLLQALIELSKLPVDSPKQFHSSDRREWYGR